jgi:hypothetical protein
MSIINDFEDIKKRMSEPDKLLIDMVDPAIIDQAAKECFLAFFSWVYPGMQVSWDTQTEEIKDIWRKVFKAGMVAFK